MIKKLEWDSNFFGMKVGRIDLNGTELMLSGIKGLETYDLVYIFSNYELNKKSLSRHYPKITFKMDMGSLIEENLSLENNIYDLPLDNVGNEEKEKLVELAFQSGISSRFKLDDNFTQNEFEELYKKWVENSINKKIADQILVSRNNNDNINGLVSLKHDKIESTIGLIAVDKDSRGKGIGSELISACKYFSLNKHSKKLVVSTQKENEKARDFYLKKGFQKNKVTHIYHLWNK